MSRSTPSGRKRAPKPSGALSAPSFDGYPYLISRIGAGPLRHIALVPADWPRERIIVSPREPA